MKRYIPPTLLKGPKLSATTAQIASPGATPPNGGGSGGNN